jgi:hypothetical protein
VTDGRPERPAPSTPPRGADRTRVSEVDASADEATPSADELEVLLRVGEMLRKLRFGTVLLVVQDGKVVQIEMAEKIRL